MNNNRYFCVRDCYFNKQYFYGRRFYSEGDIMQSVNLNIGEKSQGSKFMVQVYPTPKERSKEQQALIDDAITDMEGDLRTLKTYNQNEVRGAKFHIDRIEGTLRELRVA